MNYIFTNRFCGPNEDVSENRFGGPSGRGFVMSEKGHLRN